jgi:hypothetical protein
MVQYTFHDKYIAVRKLECGTLPNNADVADTITACTGTWHGDMVSQFGTILERMPSPLHWGPGKGVNMGQSPTAVGMAG